MQAYPNEGADYTQGIGLTPLNLEMFHLAGLNMQDERWNNDVAADNLCFRWVKEIRREVFVSCNLELVIFLNCWTFSMPDDASQLSRKLIIVSYYLYLSLKVGALTENTSSNKVS